MKAPIKDPSPKKTPAIDFSLIAILKVVSDWAPLLKKLSPVAGASFILLNIGALLRNRKAMITLGIFLPLLLFFRNAEVLRVIFAFAVFWIFLEKMTTGLGMMNDRIAVFLGIYCLVMLAGTGYPGFYLGMTDGNLRYKFLLESHNALCTLLFMLFIYQCHTLLGTLTRPGTKRLIIFLIVSICASCIVFLFIKSRLYMALTLGYLLLITIKRGGRYRVMWILPAVYALALVLLTMYNPMSSWHNRRVPLQSPSMMENSRIYGLSATGRNKLDMAVLQTYDSLGPVKFLYNDNVDHYLVMKARIPNINMKASTITESSYLTVWLVTGFAGLLVFLYLLKTYAWYFWRRRAYFSLAFLVLLSGVWWFEETLMFTFSLIGQLFALASINSLEKEDHSTHPAV